MKQTKNQLKQLYPYTITPIPQKFMKCIISRKIIQPEQYSIDIPQPKQPKDEEKERKSKVIKELKDKSDSNVRSNTLYLSMLLLLLDPTSQITFLSVKTRKTTDDIHSKNFKISSIISEGNEIFNDNDHYVIEKDKLQEFLTIKFDDKTGFPVVDETSEDNYNSDQKMRIQQHILIQTINKILNRNGMKIDYKIQKSSSKYVSSITINSYFDFNQEGYLIQIEKMDNNDNVSFPNIIYKEICNYFFDFLMYFIDYKTGKTQQLIIGDKLISTKGYKESCQCTLLGRQIIIDSFWNYRLKGINAIDFLQLINQQSLYQKE